ncbi:uncharacterized protein FIBRA_05893 [Fibroporia radiculosa]|uniref:Peptidase A1 domain-containing protein n=1 Tax=Fibroporia radiculosa TaxID=599839 RepID=J4HY99_9APHY|nr:uncharacterized protein FIBRA_05893 [Fibroporia radiculosa]CCM03747.1 predicted protein [Fibroporia radiculosa]
MALGSSLLATLVLALTVAAIPLEARNGRVTLPLAKRTSSTGVANVLARDQARAQFLKSRGSSDLKSRQDVTATNQAEDYVVTVTIGSTDYTLIVDTGSSNTWVGADKKFVKSSGTTSTGNSVEVSYGSGEFEGTEYTGDITIGGSLTVTDQSFGVASSSEGFDGVDGIIGIGPEDLTEDTVSNTNEVPTVTQNLYTQGTIAEELVSVFFAPTTSESDANGELTFGGTDASKYTGAITYTPLTTTSPASYYWGINEEITYGSDTTILSETAGIVDTGTTLVLIASNAYSKYQSATGATEDEDTGLLRLSTSEYDNLESLYFNIGGSSLEFTANAQIWPRSLNSAIGGSSDYVYLIVNNIGTPSGEGLDFINGYTFLERYYSVFDTGNSQVGFAETAYTYATTN